VNGDESTTLDFDLGGLDEVDEQDHLEPDGVASAADIRRREHAALFGQLEATRRKADLAVRETGVHALWLGYPLLYVPSIGDGDAQWILAPIFLFAARIEVSRKREGRVVISRANVGPPRFNSAMNGWLSRRFNGLQAPVPGKDALEDLTLESLDEAVRDVAKVFAKPPAWNGSGEVVAAPAPDSLRPAEGPRLFASGVLGVFRWQNEAILADLEVMKERDRCGDSLRGHLEGKPRPPSVPTAPPTEDDRYLVHPADFSQQMVVWRARKAPGLVVHGPPGTGKSQTIVNIIADALAHGESVLMLCQKEAATRVVMNRLKQAGLGDLCMELHDAEADRQAIFKRVRDYVDKVRDAPTLQGPRRRRGLAEGIERLERDLDDFACALHARHDRIGLAFKAILAVEGRGLAECGTARSLPTLAGLSQSVDGDSLKHLLNSARRAGNLFESSRFLINPWRHRLSNQLTPAALADLRLLIARIEGAESKHQLRVASHGSGMSLPEDIETFRANAAELLKRLAAASAMDLEQRMMLAECLNALDDGEGRERAAKSIHETRAMVQGAIDASHSIDAAWSESMRSAGEVERRLLRASCGCVSRRAWWRFVSRDFWRSVQIVRQKRPDALGRLVYEVADRGVVSMDAVVLVEHAITAAEGLVPGLSPSFEGLSGVRSFVDRAHEAYEAAAWFTALVSGNDWTAPVVAGLRVAAAEIDEENRAAIGVSLGRAEAAGAVLAQIGRLKEFLNLEAIRPLIDGVLAGTPIRDGLAAILDGASRMEDLQSLEGQVSASPEPNLSMVRSLVEYEKNRADGGEVPRPPPDLTLGEYGRWWQSLVGYSVGSAWREEFEQSHPILRRIGPDDREHLVNQLGTALEEKKALEVKAIDAVWRSRQRAVLDDYPWQTVFRQKGARGAPSKKMREAVHESAKRGLLSLFPCWLSNPGAAAQVFPLEEGLFDVVIFDEASQCPLEQAVPAIYRGKRLIVSGDMKQLPPTSFFAADSVEEDEVNEKDEENDTDSDQQIVLQGTLDTKDLLDATIPLLPESYLLVHYRSEHPALIEFSNRAFYEGRLEAPPSRNGASGAKPIEYIEVAGVYERRRRTNRAEAERTVAVVKGLVLSASDRPTVGVVTFNQPQRELITDLLGKECAADGAFRERYEKELNRTTDDGQDAGVFVKNLENVQGDERDVMVFSTTFGPDAAGSFFRNFGVLGQAGGERRLNVAVTRAKRKVIVVGSMPIEAIDTALGGGQGAGASLRPRSYLQLYLAYAKSIARAEEERRDRILHLVRPRAGVTTEHDVESPLEEEVFDALKRLGYAVHTQVGDSGFRIDLAVQHPDPTRGYVLGIECDGAAYHSDRSARLRDVWRQKILEGRGWHFHRVWSTRWWTDQATEIERLRARVQACIDAAG
jgi:very-short-patch-repair endonuclease